MKTLITIFVVSTLICANAMAFGRKAPQLPAELSAYTPIDQQGEAALASIEKASWAQSKTVTIAQFQTQMIILESAKISLQSDVLTIDSEAGDTAGDGGMFTGKTDNYSSDYFHAPVNFSGEKQDTDGTIHIAVGVDYMHGSAFSGPDSFSSQQIPDSDSMAEQQLVEFIVLSWNKNTPSSLTLEGISDNNAGAQTFQTSYSAQ